MEDSQDLKTKGVFNLIKENSMNFKGENHECIYLCHIGVSSRELQN